MCDLAMYIYSIISSPDKLALVCIPEIFTEHYLPPFFSILGVDLGMSVTALLLGDLVLLFKADS